MTTPDPVPAAAIAVTFALSRTAVPELRTKGFCVLRHAVPPELLHRVDAELDEDFFLTPFGQGDFYGTRTKRFGRLLARSPSARYIVDDMGIQAIALEILSPFCDTIQLNVAQAIEVHPGEIAQMPHRDQDMWRGPKGEIEYLVNVMWPLTSFTPDNGATRIWAGSHGAAALAAPPDDTGEPATCEPGDAVVFLGSTLHGAGANLTSMPRRSMVIGYSLGWLKPYENPWLAYPPEIARTFEPELQALVGYCQHRPNLGNVDGQCPSRLLADRLIDHHPGAIDALMPEQVDLVRAHAERERARKALRAP